MNRYSQEALQNGGIGVDATPVVTTIHTYTHISVHNSLDVATNVCDLTASDHQLDTYFARLTYYYSTFYKNANFTQVRSIF